MCEHPTVITIGKEGGEQHLLISSEFLQSLHIEVIPINRGGDITLHNPGQMVVYPIFNLMDYKQDLHWFLRAIEQVIIEVLKHYHIKSDRIPGKTGVWIDQKRKICAIGLHCSRWVTSHGLAFNISNDINQFEWIVPCGINNMNVTSLSQELGYIPDMNEVKQLCLKEFDTIFEKKFG
jgi:lipoyl(octanoyl) transferase